MASIKEIEELAEKGTLLSSENGRTNGVTYRERYKLPDGKYLDVTRDRGVGDNQIVQWAIRKTKRAHWQTEL